MMKLTKTAKLAYTLFMLWLTLLAMSCEERDNSPVNLNIMVEDIGTLLFESEDFTIFANLITSADLEVPEGEESIMKMLSDLKSGKIYNVFVPSNELFATTAKEWSTLDSQVSIEDVISEFTNNRQPAKTREFVLGHIFQSESIFKYSKFESEAKLTNVNSVQWTMKSDMNAPSGYSLVLGNSDLSPNAYKIMEADVLVGKNGVIHSALVPPW